MSRLQVSFAAFAQQIVCPPPPASANGSALSLAAPAEPGVGVDTTLPFDGPFKPLQQPYGFDLAGAYEGDWVGDWQVSGCLDAPQVLPSGSHVALLLGRDSAYPRVIADGYAGLPRRYLP